MIFILFYGMALCCTETPFPIIGTQVVLPSHIEQEGKEEPAEHTQEQAESE